MRKRHVVVKRSIIGLAVLAVILSPVLAADAQDSMQFYNLKTDGPFSRESFTKSLASQRRGLPFDACRVDDDYIAYIRQAYGGHVRKGGISRQIDALGDIPYQVVLPEIPSILDPRSEDSQDTDFLLQGH